MLDLRVATRAWTMGDGDTMADLAIFPRVRYRIGVDGAGERVDIDRFPDLTRV